MTGRTARLTTDADLPAVADLRHRVFVVEQGVPVELEATGPQARAEDAVAVHAVALDDAGTVVATGRLLVRDGRAVIGRMATDPAARGQGHGAAVLAVLHRAAADRGHAEVELHAQLGARRLYQRAGYACVGGVYDEAGIEHVTMRRDLAAPAPPGAV